MHIVAYRCILLHIGAYRCISLHVVAYRCIAYRCISLHIIPYRFMSLQIACISLPIRSRIAPYCWPSAPFWLPLVTHRPPRLPLVTHGPPIGRHLLPSPTHPPPSRPHAESLFRNRTAHSNEPTFCTLKCTALKPQLDLNPKMVFRVSQTAIRRPSAGHGSARRVGPSMARRESTQREPYAELREPDGATNPKLI